MLYKVGMGETEPHDKPWSSQPLTTVMPDNI